MLLKRLLVFFASLLLLQACAEREEEIDQVAYAQEMNEWLKSRFNTLNAADGWLSLVGLEWMEEGENTFGGSEENDLKIAGDNVPDQLGKLVLENEQVRIFPIADSLMTINGEGIEDGQIIWTKGEETPIVELGNISFLVIERQGKVGLRVRDSKSKTLRAFQGTDFFPIDPAWRKIATFKPYEGGKELKVQNIIGTVETQICPGYLEFSHDGSDYQLDVIIEDDQYFIIFGDLTNGEETYGAGRYMYTTFPDENNKVVLDFNKSYSPPCVFTEFATCPLPPQQNMLPIAIPVGELTYGEH